MEDKIELVRRMYDSAPEREWERLDYNIHEFELTKRKLAAFENIRLLVN